MGRMYSASFTAQSIVAAQDIVAIAAAATIPVIIHEIRLSQHGDAGDTEAEMLPLTLQRYDTVGSGGATVTPNSLDPSSPVADATVRINDTTEATVNLLPLIEDSWNVQAGWLYLPTPETRIIIPAASNIVLTSPVVPNDAILVNMTITFEEIG